MVQIDAATRPVTLLGWPIEHTLSPLIHNTGFRKQDLNYLYTASAVPPELIGEAVTGLRALDFAGANVTIPHKEAVGRYLDDVSAEARAVGAVNTIVLEKKGEERRLFGDNTDVAGFIEPLSPLRERIQGSDVLIFGSGGAARAVAYALLRGLAPSRLTIAARSPGKAERLADDLSPYDSGDVLEVRSLANARPQVRASRLLVNATPVGMAPDTEGTIWPNVDDFSAEQVAYDLVYRPRTTRWLREAGERGATTIGGLDMLIAQAAASYRHWTGRDLPEEAVRQALRTRTPE